MRGVPELPGAQIDGVHTPLCGRRGAPGLQLCPLGLVVVRQMWPREAARLAADGGVWGQDDWTLLRRCAGE